MEGTRNGQVRFVKEVVNAIVKTVSLLKAFLEFTGGYAIGIGPHLLFCLIFIRLKV
jgi:hypothetical protein